MATSKAKSTKGQIVEYVLNKGSSRLLNARVERREIHLYVNGPAMLFGSARLLTSLDLPSGATHAAWTKLAATLRCTSLCGQNGQTSIPLEVVTSRIGTHLEFSTGPMAMYQSLLVLKSRRDQTVKAAIDEAFGNPTRSYSVVIVPEPATGHVEHDGSLFAPEGEPTDEHTPSSGGSAHAGHTHDHH